MDSAHGRDSVRVGAEVSLKDVCRASTHWLISRYTKEQTDSVKLMTGTPHNVSDELFSRYGAIPFRTSVVHGNLIANAGWTRLMNLLTNQGATQALDATHTRIGVGNSSTAETYTDTDLIAAAGSANRWFQPVTGAGTLGTRTLAFAASFGGSDGNFAWNEFGIDVTSGTAAAGNTVGALLFNRKAGIAQGTKANGQTWTVTATITFS